MLCFIKLMNKFLQKPSSQQKINEILLKLNNFKLKITANFLKKALNETANEILNEK